MTQAATLERQTDATLEIATPARAHLVGIAGAGMRSLADVLDAAGWQIGGSDLAEPTGAPFHARRGHHAEAEQRQQEKTRGAALGAPDREILEPRPGVEPTQRGRPLDGEHPEAQADRQQ